MRNAVQPTFEDLLSRLKGDKMNRWEKRAQKIDWAVLVMNRRWPPLDEWMLRLTVAKALEK